MTRLYGFSLTVLFYFLLPFNAAKCEFTSSKCSNVTAFKKVFLDKGLTCENALKVQKVASSIKQFTPWNDDLVLFLQTKSEEAFAHIGGLVTVNKDQVQWGLIKSHNLNEYIWAHELGHTVFNVFMLKNFSAITGFYEYMAKSRDLSVSKALPKINDNDIKGVSWSKEFGLARDLQVPYSEMFADLVAVLYSNDSEAMVKAMTSDKMPAHEKKKRQRFSFSGQYNVELWNEVEVHEMLAPARAHIGKTLLHWPLSRDKKAEIMSLVADAIIQELNKHWAHGKRLPSPSATNNSLIERIDQLVSAPADAK